MMGVQMHRKLKERPKTSCLYTRFTTSDMTKILPDLKDAPSAWNTESHYFYEINNAS